MAAMRKALLSLTPLVAGVAIAAWPASEFDYCQLQITYWDKQETQVRDRGYIAVDEKTGKPYKTGEWVTWFQNGTILSRGDYIEGKLHGRWLYWFQTGQKRSDLTFAAGTPTGLSTSWHPNGQKAEERFFGADELRMTRWHENGQKSNEGNMRGPFGAAKMDGVWTFWYPNGQKRTESTYKLGKLDGTQTHWDEQGNVTQQTHWKNGEQVDK